MAFYTVMTPPAADAGPRGGIERARVIPDAFSWGAFLLTGLWLLGRRLWLATLIFALVWGAVWFVHRRLGIHDGALTLLYGTIALFLGFEGRNMVVRKLTRQGWQLADVVEARSLADAERRYFERALAAHPVAPRADAAASVAMARPMTALPIIGLFPEARRR
jgi:hypothetical protein